MPTLQQINIDDFNATMSLLDEFHLILVKGNCDLYRLIIENKDDEQLAQEFCDKIGSELSEFEWMMKHRGRSFVEDYLCDRFDALQFEKYIGKYHAKAS